MRTAKRSRRQVASRGGLPFLTPLLLGSIGMIAVAAVVVSRRRRPPLLAAPLPVPQTTPTPAPQTGPIPVSSAPTPGDAPAASAPAAAQSDPAAPAAPAAAQGAPAAPAAPDKRPATADEPPVFNERRALSDPEALQALLDGTASRIGFDLERLDALKEANYKPLMEYLQYIQVQRGESDSLIFVRGRDLDQMASITGNSREDFVHSLKKLGVLLSMN